MREFVHYLARSIGCAPQAILVMPLYEIELWVDLENENQKREEKRQDDTTRMLLRALGATVK